MPMSSDTDSWRCADPQKIIDRFAPEFEKLLLLTLMLPWANEVSRLAGPCDLAMAA